jgi:peptidoglycan/LPS O-acetylase OafA/YrhL
MALNDYFVSHLNLQNQIPTNEATFSLTIIFTILLAVIFITTKWRKLYSSKPSDIFRHETSDALRGIAVLCLLFGHFAIQCVEGKYFFELAGRWAVIIFLFISGIGLTKKYSLSNLPSNFIYRRIIKLLPSVWIAISLFSFLDFILLSERLSGKKIVINLLGIITTDASDPAAWYITYIITIYVIYFILSKFSCNRIAKILILYSVCYSISIAIWTFKPISNHISIWSQYAIVFPSSVGIGLFFKFIHNKLTSLLRKNKAFYVFITLFLLYVYISEIALGGIAHLYNSYPFGETVSMIYDLLLICAVLLLTVFIDYYHITSTFLSLLGKHSFEVFLIHLPFMWKYDFILFRKPLALMLLLYFSFVIIASIFFKTMTRQLSNFLKNYLIRRSAGRNSTGTFSSLNLKQECEPVRLRPEN